MAVFVWVFRTVLALFSLLITHHSLAAEPAAADDGPRWACWYAPDDVTVRCLLTQAPTAGHAERDAAAERAYDPRLPDLVRTIWGAPERLAGRSISIPLWTPPVEMDFVRELADAVICTLRTACSIRFDANDDGLAAVRAAALAAGASEAEVLAMVIAEGFTPSPAPASLVSEEAPQATVSRRRSGRRATS